MEATPNEAIRNRASAIFRIPDKDIKMSEFEHRLNRIANHIAQKELEQEAWQQQIEDFLLNRTLGPEEAGKLLLLSTDGVRKSIMAGNLGGGKEGGRWKTSYRDIVAYMQARPKKFGQNINLMDVVKVI